MAHHTGYRARHSRSFDLYRTNTYSSVDQSLPPKFRRHAVSAWVMVLPTAATLLLGGIFLGRASMWTDEGATWISSIQSIPTIIRNSAHIDVVFLPYYLFMHFWLEVSQSLWWARLPSLIAGAAAVQALVWLARRWLSVAWSVLAGFLLALNPVFARWMIDARPYTATTLFAVISTAALVTAIYRGSKFSWVRYGFASLCMIFLQATSVFLLASQLVGMAAARRRSAWRGMILTLACLAVAVSPLLIVAAGETEQISWIAPPTLRTFAHALLALSGGPVEAAVLALCGVMLTVIAASSVPGSDTAFSSTLVLAWAALPPVLLILTSFLHPLYQDRYALVSVPGIALIEAMALRHAWAVVGARRRSRVMSGRETQTSDTLGSVHHHGGQPRWIHWLATIICVGACFAGPALLINTGQVLLQRYFEDDYRSAAAALSGDLSEHPAPVAIIPDWSGIGFSYYVTPSALGHALSEYEAQALDRTTPTWHVLNWPIGTTRENPAVGCAVGWAIGRGIPPSGPFTIDGSSCRLAQVQHFGEVWVAAAHG